MAVYIFINSHYGAFNNINGSFCLIQFQVFHLVYDLKRLIEFKNVKL